MVEVKIDMSTDQADAGVSEGTKFKEYSARP